MTITREHLELAALAAGIELEYRHTSDAHYYDDQETGREEWRPHLDLADAARLAVRLNIRVVTNEVAAIADRHWEITKYHSWHDGTEPDKLRAWREAVVLCAAAYGKRMRGER